MGTENATDTAATIIIGQNVRAGSEQPYQEWQKDLNREASKYPGFLGAEINPPTAVQQEWVVVYRFDSIPHVMAWLNSATRQERLAVGQQFFDGPGTQQVLGGGTRQADPLVTVAVSHRVSQEDVEEFLDWQDRLRVAESRFPGSAEPSCSGPSKVCRRSGPPCTATTAPPTWTGGWSPTSVKRFWRRARSSPTSIPAPSTTRSAAGLRSTRRRRPVRRRPRRRSPYGRVCIPRSCSSPWCCRHCICRCGLACSWETCAPASP